MAGRLPFNMPGHSGQNSLHDAQIRAALGLSQVDEALYLQRQQEIQRDFQIRQMLLQDQLDQQSRLDSIVAEQRLKQIREQLHDYPDLQQHYSQLLLRDRLQREQEERTFLERAQLQQQEELQRRALAQSQAQQQPGTQQSSPQSQSQSPPRTGSSQSVASRDIAADSLAGNAVKRSELEKRAGAKSEEDYVAAKKRPRSETEESVESEQKQAKNQRSPRKGDETTTSEDLSQSGETSNETAMKPSAQALLDFASSTDHAPASPPAETYVASVASVPIRSLGDLLKAAESEKESGDAASVLTGIKKHVEWTDSEQEDSSEVERQIAIKKGDTIMLPNFASILPQLPEEPTVAAPPAAGQSKKHKGILDDDSVDAKTNGKAKLEKKEQKETTGQANSADLAVVEYPYPIDTWWPSVTSIRRERKASGEPHDDGGAETEVDSEDPNSPFRANLSHVRDRLASDVAPGVLEKIPHCRIHRMLMKKRKNPSAPELVYCFQVTELYPNDLMVCCSHCGTWRHTACGGHHKPYSVRECIDSPFTAVCDRCHEEEKVLRDYPTARKRIDRQRSEQVRRGLATSAAMRQASFSKHGGTYKWPLGSVSATHIGGHTRSVHSRHDKAEKQWMDMATRLGRGYGYRPKERVKVRTKELERLLVSVEDAEGHTDRHNMMLFLLQDTLQEHPAGFETRRRNIFDPEEDDMPADAMDEAGSSQAPSEASTKDVTDNTIEMDHTAVAEETEADDSKREPTICARNGCQKKPRFDSLFCSDACGVSALENDLLRTFQYASDIHPSLLRN